MHSPSSPTEGAQDIQAQLDTLAAAIKRPASRPMPEPATWLLAKNQQRKPPPLKATEGRSLPPIKADDSSSRISSGNLDLTQNPFYREFTPLPLTPASQSLSDLHGDGAVRDLREAANDWVWRRAG